MEFIEVSAKTVDDAITEASIKLGTTSDKIEVEVIEKGSTGFLGIKSKPAIIKARKKNDTVDNIREFLKNVFSAMNMEVTIDIKKAEDDKVYEVELSGKEMGLLIGKRGQTLDSLQYLTNLLLINIRMDISKLSLIPKITAREEKILWKILQRILHIRLREQNVRYL